jgi:hypothetical protein
MKTPEERIDKLERHLRTYRTLAILLGVLICAIERGKIVAWIDHMEGWAGVISSARANP